jgi:xanthine dehydrogenase accessory factor
MLIAYCRLKCSESKVPHLPIGNRQLAIGNGLLQCHEHGSDVLELLDQIVSRADRGEPLAVCTLVRTRGSTPQKTGAMMVVLADGQTLGTIGGGCVEAEVRTRALQLISHPSPRLLTFKLDHDLGWDDGLVCGGVMDVAVQVVGTAEQAADFRKARDQLAQGTPAVLQITVRDEHDKIAHFSSPLQPAPTLVIAGAGHVGAALAAIAGQMDFHVMVIDDRPDFASPKRFPGATLRVGAVEAELAKVQLDQQTYVVIVTRGHRRDALALAAVVRSQARYIGLIGSRRKIITIFSELREQGVSTEQLTRVHAPIGLNIGAVTPAEIAVSIAAELIAARRGSIDRPVTSMQLTPAQMNRV